MQFIAVKYKRLRIVLDPKAAKEVEGRRTMVGLKGDFPIGKTVEFEDGYYNTEDPLIIKALLDHENYGYSFYTLQKDKKGKVIEPKPTEAALRRENERRALVQDVGNTDPNADKDKKKPAEIEPAAQNPEEQD